jgi:ribosomal protein S8E
MNFTVKVLVFIVFTILILSITQLLGCQILNVKQVSILPAIAISTGVLIASLAYLRDKNKHELDARLKTDELQLQITKDGFDEVNELISNLDNSRVVWIRAARVLLNTLELGELITTPQLKKAFQAHREYLRVNLYQALHIEPEDSAKSDKESLPPQFFYGIENWRDRTISLDDAALSSRSKTKAHRVTIDRVISEPKNTELDQRSVVAIYDFISSYDESYVDPLSKVKEWEGDLMGSFGIQQGPARYIEHSSKYMVSDGKLHELKKS